MDQSVPVDLIQRIRNLDRILDDIIYRQCASFEPLREGFSFQVFHDEIVEPVLVSDIMNHANVRVVESRYGLRLASKALVDFRLLGNILEKNLDRNIAVKTGISRFVHFTHAARTNGRKDKVPI